MDCKAFEENISLYIDNELTDTEKREFEIHMFECNKCRISYENTLNIVKEMKNIEKVDVPKDFRKQLRNRLEKESNNKRKRFFKPFYSTAAVIVFVLIASITLISMLNINQNGFMVKNEITEESQDMNMGTSPEYDSVGAAEESISSKINQNSLTLKDESRIATFESKSPNDIEEKIIREAYLEISTHEYDKVFQDIVGYIKQNKGYIENSETSYIHKNEIENEMKLKRGYMQLRIPEEMFFDTIIFIKGLGEVNSERVSEIDVTKQYYDTENIIKNLQIQEERLREILKKAQNVQEILQVENELRRIRTEIDSYTSSLKSLDHQSNMSLLRVTLIEVERNDTISYVNQNLWDKAKKGFISTVNKIIKLFENIFVGFISILPVIIIITFLVVLYMIIKKLIINGKKGV